MVTTKQIAKSIQKGFNKNEDELTLYVKHQSMVDILIIELYVDDLVLMGSNTKMIKKFREKFVYPLNLSLN